MEILNYTIKNYKSNLMIHMNTDNEVDPYISRNIQTSSDDFDFNYTEAGNVIHDIQYYDEIKNKIAMFVSGLSNSDISISQELTEKLLEDVVSTLEFNWN
jgi:hypothetical protein